MRVEGEGGIRTFTRVFDFSGKCSHMVRTLYVRREKTSHLLTQAAGFGVGSFSLPLCSPR